MRALLLLALLAGCATAGPDPALTGTEWVVTSIRGAAPAGSSRVTLRFDEKGAGGYGGCNWYGGAYEASGGEVEWKEMSSTMRACAESALMDQEAVYLAALGTVTRYRVEGDLLVLSDAGGSPVVELSRRSPLPMNPDDLIGTEWRLESIDGEPPAGTAPLTIAFPETGTITGFAGCREFAGRYIASGDRFTLPETRMSGTECDAPRAIALQEGDFTTYLSETEHYRLAGERLEMTTAAGRTLVFVRR